MRYEIKYEVAEYASDFIRNAVFVHPSSFLEAFPDRQVHNIYFDTMDLDFFYQNINGDPDRRKIRLRWYDRNYPGKDARLEIKCKQRELGWKEITNVDQDLSDMSLGEITEYVNDVSKPGQQLDASLINNYSRSYYESFDRKFRLTLDKNISFKQPDLIAFEGGNIVLNTTVLEIKFEEKEMEYFEDVNRYFPFRQTKYSKYSNGLIMIRS